MCKKLDFEFLIIGALSNTIFRSGIIYTVIIQTTNVLDMSIDFIDQNKSPLAYFSTGSFLASSELKLNKHQLTSFTSLVGIPATIGGAVIMNAGSYGVEIKDIIHSVRFLDSTSDDLSIQEESDLDFFSIFLQILCF